MEMLRADELIMNDEIDLGGQHYIVNDVRRPKEGGVKLTLTPILPEQVTLYTPGDTPIELVSRSIVVA